MAVQPNYPAATPSLLLDFANNKRLDPRITFTRTTTATYYDGSTTAKAEENLFLYSQEFDNAWWAKEYATITANTLAAPDGTTTADTLAENTTNNLHRTQPAFISFTSGQTYTFSVYAKNGDRNFVQLFFPPAFSTSDYANFDISTGVLGTVGGAATASIVNVGSGWYRCIVTATATSTASGAPSIGLITSATSIRAENYLGASKFIYIWGAQLEQRSSVTAYTATTTQPITNYIPVLQTAAVGQARFDHNPTTDESLGLLVEEARTNLVTYSADFSNAAWVKGRINITANTIVAPDGTLTGNKLVEDTTPNQSHLIYQLVTVSAISYTVSVYLKAAEWTSFQIQLGSGGPRGDFNISSVSATTILGATSASITSVGNGWYRCSVTGTPTAGSMALYMYKTSALYNGDGYSGIYIWGAQIEAGSNPTSYIPTVASAVTRNAETCSMQDTSSFYNVSEGTLYVKVSALPQTGNATVAYPAIGFTPAALNSTRTIQIFKPSNSNIWYYLVRTASGDSAQIQFSGAASAIATMAFAYKINDFAASLNGATALTDTSGDLPLGSEIPALCIGSFNLGGRINGTINKIAYYPVRITNANLQALTS